MQKFIAMVLLFGCLSVHAELIPENAAPDKIADGYRFTEGPALGPDGCIYFTDIPASLILKFDPNIGETTEFRTDTGGANGLMWFEGDLYICCHRARALRRYPINPAWYQQAEDELPLGNDRLKLQMKRHPTQPDVVTKETNHNDPITGQAKTLRFNSPNDLAIDSQSFVYFTDPRYGNRDDMQMQTEGVYFTTLFEREGLDALNLDGPRAKLIDGSLGRPNGIALSPDESILYVADNAANWIFAYDIVKPGEVKNKRPFARINAGGGGGSDGMCVDPKGRLYATGHGKVWVFEPTGQLVATIPVGPQTTNVTFAADGKTLYITANKGLYRITLNTDAALRYANAEVKVQPMPERIVLKLIPMKRGNAEDDFLIHLHGRKIEKNDLAEALSAVHQKYAKLPLHVQADTAVKYNTILKYIQAAQHAGFEQIQLAAGLND